MTDSTSFPLDLSSVQPRPGGYVKIKRPASPNTTLINAAPFARPLPEEHHEALAKKQQACTTTRQFRIKEAVSICPWPLMEEEEDMEPKNALNNCIDMLAISLSTVMLLAAGYQNPPKEHLQWTYSYLDQVRNEFGNHPPNVQGILNHISQISGGDIKSLVGQAYHQEAPPTSSDSAAPTAPEAGAADDSNLAKVESKDVTVRTSLSMKKRTSQLSAKSKSSGKSSKKSAEGIVEESNES